MKKEHYFEAIRFDSIRFHRLFDSSFLPFHVSHFSSLVSAISFYAPPCDYYFFFFGACVLTVFAVGLLLQSTDVLDPRLILTTSEEPEWSANCVSEQIARSDLGFDIPVAIGETLPPYSERGTVCGVPGLVGFALKETCAERPNQDLPPPIPNGVEHAAAMLMESDRNDWTYIAIGGQTSLKKLIRDYPEALSKIQNLVVMGGNWCTGFDAYPDVPTPTAETNIGCDMAAANFVLEVAAKATHHKRHFPAIHYVPIVTVNVLSGDDYSMITHAASQVNNNNNNPHYNKAAHATLDFYNAWSASARSNPGLLVHKEAMTYDPSTESTPQFDAVAVMVAMDIARGASGTRVAQHEFANGVYFVTNQEAAVANDHPEFFRGNPAPAAHSLWSGDEASLNHKVGSGRSNNNGDIDPISARCQGLTHYHFDPSIAPPFSSLDEAERRSPPVRIRAALGFVSQETEKDFFHEMALRISGRFASQFSQSMCEVSAAIATAAVAVAAATPVELNQGQIEQNVSTAAPSPPPSSFSLLLLKSALSTIATEEYSIVA
jgi:inosine-uridine nucleoside N-ribohydrolase